MSHVTLIFVKLEIRKPSNGLLCSCILNMCYEISRFCTSLEAM